MRGIEYKSKKAKEALFGAGRYARSIQHGKREYEGTLTVLQSELIAFDRAAVEAGRTDVLDLDLDFVISYASENGIVTVDRVICASITETTRGMKEGDLNMEVELPFIALRVKPNVA
ncbi:MAG: hypothetical protein NC410_10520 [Oscillibacter sp.]|nr:hypothetical protein [Oscillibacter sp.]